MKKIMITTAVAVLGAFAANATNPPAPCCDEPTQAQCAGEVTVEIANILEMNCNPCFMSNCVNTFTEWQQGLDIGAATISIKSTSPYDVYAGATGANVGNTGLMTLSAGSQTQLSVSTANRSLAGAPVYAAKSNLLKKTGNSGAALGTKIVTNAGAHIADWSKKVDVIVSVGAIPLGTDNGEYSTPVVVTAIQP